jgi:hypothetical protein
LRFLGAVRANSCAVLLPMPELAPVIRTVLPSRRLAIAVDMLLWVARRVRGVKRDVMGVVAGLKRAVEEVLQNWASFIRVNWQDNSSGELGQGKYF